MCQSQSQPTRGKALVDDVYQKSAVTAFAHDSIRESAQLFNDGASAIPVFDYTRKIVGVLNANSLIQFQIAYFENLNCCDRGNEFLFEHNTDSEIHFVPIDRVSRYMSKSYVRVGVGDSVEEVEATLAETNQQAALVFDTEENYVGSVSLLNIARAKHSKKCCGKCGSTTQITHRTTQAENA